MGAWERVKGAWSALTGKSAGSSATISAVFPDDYRARYDIQDWFYNTSDLYEKQAAVGMGPGKDVRALFLIPYRIVEFYPAHLWPEPLEDLPLVADKEATADGARTILEWSNWGEKKQEVARQLPTRADVYFKAEDAEDSEKVYVKVLEPREVTEFDKDERGNATKVRLDIPVTEGTKQRTRTEVWSKDKGRVDVYVHDRGPAVKEEELEGKVSADSYAFEDAGIDFVPFVHCQFLAGAERGKGAFAHLIGSINEVNKMTSRGSDLLFRHGKPLWQYLRNEAGQGAADIKIVSPDKNDGATVEEVGSGDAKETVIRNPGLAKMEALIPDIPYESGRNMRQDLVDEMTNTSPELTYYAQRDKGDPSGRAIGLMLSAPRKRGEEVRYNAETALLKCVKMCLTIAWHKGSLTTDPGDFDAGDFDSLKFEERPVLPVTEEEKAATVKVELENLAAAIDLARQLGMDVGPLKEKLARLLEMDPDEVEEAVPEDPDAESIGQAPEVEALARQLGVGGGAGDGQTPVNSDSRGG